MSKVRLHQTAFRERVIHAYRCHCTMCKLKHRELLDAAHITPDREESGEPVVSNGLSLCKIHHAAYDKNILGVSPDYVIHVREDILEEIDGPMLRYGLQGMHGQKLHEIPSRKELRPDRERLEKRYKIFMSA
jgi:putative restriction endonuclease